MRAIDERTAEFVNVNLKTMVAEATKSIDNDSVEHQPQDLITPVCPTCQTTTDGKFCPNCGEQILIKPDYSFRGLFSETINVFTNLESNIFRSFGYLLTKPGLLTADYFLGRRKRYLKPLQLFIFCNIIFFFVQAISGFNSLRTPLRVHISQMPYSQMARRKVGDVLLQRGITYKDYESKFNSVIETQAKTLVFIMIPMFALGLKLLYVRKREYFVKHLVFSTHFFSYYLLLLSLSYVLLDTILSWLRINQHFTDFSLTIIILSIAMLYLLFAARRVYAERWLISILKAFGMIGVLAVCVQSFRLILFFTAFYLV